MATDANPGATFALERGHPFAVVRRMRIMAGGAIGPERTVVNIILTMTVDAGRRGFPVGGGGTVAGAACEGHMRTLQGKVRQIVRETRLAQLVDIGVAPQVLGMAAAALTRCSTSTT